MTPCRVLLGLLLLLLLAPVAAEAAPTLLWDAVTTDVDGLPLGPGLEVTSYRVYACGPGIGQCSKATGTVAGTVAAPATQLDLAGLPVPQVYFITAVNKAGESVESATLKVTPSSAPKNVRLE